MIGLRLVRIRLDLAADLAEDRTQALLSAGSGIRLRGKRRLDLEQLTARHGRHLFERRFGHLQLDQLAKGLGRQSIGGDQHPEPRHALLGLLSPGPSRQPQFPIEGGKQWRQK